jgi:transposase
MEEVSTVGLDIAKSVFQVHCVSSGSTVIVRRQLKRRQVVAFFSSLKPCLIGIEACATGHYWARELVKLGHNVRLMPPRYVKPYVKRNKNDAADAEAICEAVTRPTMRFVPIKTEEQQSIMVLHRTRQMFIRQRTTLINAIRSHLAEFGIVAGIGRHGVDALLEVIAKDEDCPVPLEAKACLSVLADQLGLIKRHILEPLISTAIVANVPDPAAFRSGRDLSAWIGLVPKQNSSGGKEKLGSISKAGNRYLRQLLVVGALSVIRRAKQLGYTRHPWLVKLMERRSVKIAAVALASKMARTAWAMMRTGEAYRSLPTAAA